MSEFAATVVLAVCAAAAYLASELVRDIERREDDADAAETLEDGMLLG